jgi:parvulin-like peptidyl-prolyl isomerase
MTQSPALWRTLLGAAVLLGGVAAASAQTKTGGAAAAPRVDPNVSPVSANIPAATDKAAARVNGEMISMAEVKTLLDQRPYPVSLTEEQKKALRQAAVDMLVDDVLMRQYLAKNAPQVAPAEVTREYQDVVESLKKQKKTVQDLLREAGQTDAQLRKDIVARLQWKAYLRARMPEAEVKKYYDDNKPFFDKIFVRASHILVKVPSNATVEQKQALRQKAEAIRQQVVAGKIDFAAAAKQYSECPSKDKGGDIGQFPYKFVVVEPFARAAFALKVGAVSDVVTSDFGYHVIKVTDRTQPKDVQPYEQIRESIREVWAQDVELFQRILAEQRKNSKIEVYLQ